MNGGFFAGPAPVAPGVPLGAMGFDSKPGLRGLGGATRKEETREEVLRKAKEERAAREGVRRQARAAALVQASSSLHPPPASSAPPQCRGALDGCCPRAIRSSL